MIDYPQNWIKNDKLNELVESTLQDNKPFGNWLFDLDHVFYSLHTPQ